MGTRFLSTYLIPDLDLVIRELEKPIQSDAWFMILFRCYHSIPWTETPHEHTRCADHRAVTCRLSLWVSTNKNRISSSAVGCVYIYIYLHYTHPTCTILVNELQKHNNRHSTIVTMVRIVIIILETWDTSKSPMEGSRPFFSPHHAACLYQVGAYHHPCPCAQTAITLLEPSGGCYHLFLANGKDLINKKLVFQQLKLSNISIIIVRINIQYQPQTN